MTLEPKNEISLLSMIQDVVFKHSHTLMNLFIINNCMWSFTCDYFDNVGKMFGGNT